jgi:hypothetical protein
MCVSDIYDQKKQQKHLKMTLLIDGISFSNAISAFAAFGNEKYTYSTAISAFSAFPSNRDNDNNKPKMPYAALASPRPFWP